MLTTLVSVDPIYASFDADEHSVEQALATLPGGHDFDSEIGLIPVQMGTLAEEGTPLQGRLQLIDNLVDRGSGTVRVRAIFNNADGRLMPGQFARMRMGEATTAPTIAIDESAIGTDQDRRFVMVVGGDNRAVYRQVQLGPVIDGQRVITHGLSAGERIVVDGLQRIGPGSLVAPHLVAMTPLIAPACLRVDHKSSSGHTMNISKFFIDRPVFAGVLSMLIFIAGLLALGALPISEYPEVVPPQVVVRANYPGASPKVIAETVATPIEEQIEGVEGMLYMAARPRRMG